MSAAPSYGRVADAWRAGAGAAWSDYVDHAFVMGLEDGTLPRACYLRYLRQDYLFLIHFTRAWALGAVKAGDLREMRACLAAAEALVNEEMRLHVETCAREGIDADALAATEEAPATMAYTRFTLDAGHSGDFLDLMAALAPCVFGYGEIGARLGAATGPDAPYAEWIGTYAGEPYQGFCREIGGLIDRATSLRLGPAPERAPRWAALLRTHRDAARLEAAFWSMGLEAV